MTQREKILRFLDDFGSITPLQAMAEFGIMRLAARISEIEKAGIPIEHEMVKGWNRYGETTHFMRYRRAE